MASAMRFLVDPVRQSEGREDGGGSFTDPVFDDEYYGRDKEGGRARTAGLVVGVIAGAIIAGTAAWFVFGPEGRAGRGQTPLIAAEPGPYKVRPDDPGGLEVENQDKLVYERLGGGSDNANVENILPPPETPVAPVTQEPQPPVQVAEPAQRVPAEAASPSPATEHVQQGVPLAPPEPVEQVQEQMTSVAPDTAPIAQPQEETVPVPVPPAPAASSSLQQPQTLESMVAALSGDYLIQIAALRSEEAAQGEWDRVSTRYQSLLGAYRPTIVRADLGERGIFYRLRAGPLATRSDAETLCAALAAENVGCLVVRNE